MNALIIGGITYALNDGNIRTKYGRGDDGKRTARLVLGEERDELTIVVTDSASETLARLEAAVAELRAEAERQERLANLPEVAGW
ncbi:hypothetical protein ACFYNA_15615 [Streptomyces sp. NPDC006640]|uniref:hypothetical protein n=1 Tax=Streptomyces sp. NPDC006640 TaxID=3364754 RepID=UPI003676996F